MAVDLNGNGDISLTGVMLISVLCNGLPRLCTFHITKLRSLGYNLQRRQFDVAWRKSRQSPVRVP